MPILAGGYVFIRIKFAPSLCENPDKIGGEGWTLCSNPDVIL